MGLVRVRVQGNLTKVWLNKESLSEKSNGLDPLPSVLCEPMCWCLGNGRSLSLLKTWYMLFLSCLLQNLVFFHLSQVPGPMLWCSLSSMMLGALPCSSDPGPRCTLLFFGVSSRFQMPYAPFVSSCPLPAKIVPGVVRFYGHCGKHPLAGCTLFILFIAIIQ